LPSRATNCRNRGILQHVVERAGLGLCKNLIAIDEECHRPAAFDGFEQPHLEPHSQDVEQPPNAADREAPPSQVRKDHQLEQLDGRVASLGEAPGLGAMRRHRGLQHSSRIPPLQLPRAESSQRRHFARGVQFLQTHSYLFPP
jgi:hypothetical protein